MTRRAVLLAACALLPAQAPAPGAAGPEGLTLRTCAVVTQDRARNYPAGCWDTVPRGVRRVYIAVYGLPIGSSWDAVLLNPQGRPMASVRNPVARAPSVVWFGAASLPVGSYTVRIMPSAAPPAEISFEIVPPPDPAGPPAVTVDAPREVRERASLPVVARTAPGATCTGTGTTTNHPLGQYRLPAKSADQAGLAFWFIDAGTYSSSTTITIWCSTPRGSASGTAAAIIVP
jgi:hypothetical protein